MFPRTLVWTQRQTRFFVDRRPLRLRSLVITGWCAWCSSCWGILSENNSDTNVHRLPRVIAPKPVTSSSALRQFSLYVIPREETCASRARKITPSYRALVYLVSEKGSLPCSPRRGPGNVSRRSQRTISFLVDFPLAICQPGPKAASEIRRLSLVAAYN